mgnify:FL=1
MFLVCHDFATLRFDFVFMNDFGKSLLLTASYLNRRYIKKIIKKGKKFPAGYADFNELKDLLKFSENII